MILHQGDRYVCNGTQVHPGSLNFLKSSLEIGVARTLSRLKNCIEIINEVMEDAKLRKIVLSTSTI